MKHLLRVSLLVFALALATACGQTTPASTTTAQPSGPTEAASAPASELYIFIPMSLDNPYWDACLKGLEAQAKQLGVTAEFLGPETADPAQQLAILEAAITRNPAGIAISPSDPKSVEGAIAKARAAGIPVITWDADAPESERIVYIGTDNVAAGKVAGEELAKAIGGKGKVAILTGSLTALDANQRVDGFKEALKAFPEITIVAIEPTDDSITTALAKALAILEAHPDLAAFYGVTGTGVPGAGGAVKQAGKCGEVKVIGFDVVPQGIDLVKANCAQTLISQRPYGMTAQALTLLHDLHAGKPAPSAPIDTGVEVVLPEMLDDFLKQDH